MLPKFVYMHINLSETERGRCRSKFRIVFIGENAIARSVQKIRLFLFLSECQKTHHYLQRLTINMRGLDDETLSFKVKSLELRTLDRLKGLANCMNYKVRTPLPSALRLCISDDEKSSKIVKLMK